MRCLADVDPDPIKRPCSSGSAGCAPPMSSPTSNPPRLLGRRGMLLAPMTYQTLTTDDVFELYRTVTESTELPVIVYDNPGITHFTFTTDLYSRIAELPGIASIKIPGVPTDPAEAAEQVTAIRAVVPEHVTIGVSGDAFAGTGLNAGCDTWYSTPSLAAPCPPRHWRSPAPHKQAIQQVPRRSRNVSPHCGSCSPSLREACA
uniref:Dihydrodipicolinate synthase n=1 Tax=Rhodococcus sp. NS1 TaxID=402236 RepID=A0A097SQQ1_9NOCA|nr:hypothetical protein LRS1606.408 [Rhodococcus sp. NS1]